MEALIRIQKELIVLKDQKAAYYNFRTVEGIYVTVKPLLQTAILTCSDTIISLSPRFYLKATATLKEGSVSESADGWAREQDQKKGLEAAQVTGGCSSYARKYALCGLFLIDNGLDPDANQPPPPETPGDGNSPPASDPPPPQAAQTASPPAGQIPAPTKDQRHWLSLLYDSFVAVNSGKAVDKQKLLRLCHLHLQRYPGSVNDVELLKKYISLSEIL